MGNPCGTNAKGKGGNGHEQDSNIITSSASEESGARRPKKPIPATAGGSAHSHCAALRTETGRGHGRGRRPCPRRSCGSARRGRAHPLRPPVLRERRGPVSRFEGAAALARHADGSIVSSSTRGRDGHFPPINARQSIAQLAGIRQSAIVWALSRWKSHCPKRRNAMQWAGPDMSPDFESERIGFNIAPIEHFAAH
jgi:hypothetical protein